MPAVDQMNLDLIAFAWFLAMSYGYRTIAAWEPLQRRSIVGGVQRQRVAWMRTMANRGNRVVDGVLLQGLSQGNAFFASTSAIAIGGLAAMLGSGDKVPAFIERLPLFAKSETATFEMKILLLMAIFIYAFFKFAWGFRLTHYTAIMIGATPLIDGTEQAERERHAELAARLIGVAADHVNAGLRSYYYAFAAMAWFFHPLLFMAATSWVLFTLVRRDFFSRSARILGGRS